MCNLKDAFVNAKENFKNASFVSKCEMLCFLFLCLFFFGCSLTGGGHYVHIGPVTPRIFLGFGALVLALPTLFKNFKKTIKNPINLMVIAFTVYMIVCAVRGYLAENRMDVLISDVKGFMWLFLVPVVIAIVNSKERFEKIITTLVFGAFLQGCFVLIINLICVVVPEGIKIFYTPLMTTMMGNVSNITEIIIRIFMKSSPYMTLAVCVAVFRQIKLKKLNFFYTLVIVVCTNALIFSFTRSLYGGIIVSFLCVVVVCLFFMKKHFKRCMAILLVTMLMTFGCVIVQEFAFGGNYINFAISRTFNTKPVQSPVIKLRTTIINFANSLGSNEQPGGNNDDIEEQEKYIDITEVSDNIRAQTKKELKELIVKNPVFGNGLGASAPCRSEGVDEYFYMDVLARMGVIGLILYLLPFGYIMIICLKRRRLMEDKFDICALICGIMGFWAVTWFNPWMNAVLGIACYALCAAIPKMLDKKENL